MTQRRLVLGADPCRRATGRLVGWNLGRGTLFAGPDDTRHPEWRTPARVAAVEHLAKVRAPSGALPWVRWSGLQIDGALGQDGYHFERYEGTTPGRDDNLSPEQVGSLVRELGGELLVTLNFGSGTAQEAARYAARMTEVVAHGQEGARGRPLRFEIGNEVYAFWNTGYALGPHGYANPAAVGGGDPPWHGRPSRRAEDYAARALTYVDAVTAVSPGARFWVPFGQATLEDWGGVEPALRALRPLLVHPAVEAVVVHQYTLDDGRVRDGGDLDDPRLLLAGSERFRARLGVLARRLHTLPREEPLDVAITEYHVAGAFARGAFRRGDQALTGLGIADALLTFAQLGIGHGCQHLSLFDPPPPTAGEEGGGGDRLVEPWYQPFRRGPDGGSTLTLAPSYVVTRFVAEHLLTCRAHLDEEEPLFATLPPPAGPLRHRVLHGAAFTSRDGDEASVLILHRGLDSACEVALQVPGGLEVRSAALYAPQTLHHDAVREPLTPRSLDHRRLAQGEVSFAIPPHALVGLKLEATRAS